MSITKTLLIFKKIPKNLRLNYKYKKRKRFLFK